jgi:8-hydroxy-5-deazaflavin:NADPH oxidoreductase
MNIGNVAIIGTGSVGGALATQFAQVGHKVFLGSRNPKDEKVKSLISDNISAHSIADAASSAEVILLAVPAKVGTQIAKSLGDLSGRVVIDATNGVFAKTEGYETVAEAIIDLCNTQDVVKCFNTIGANNMSDPRFGDEKADMFVAGDSEKGKEIATQLAKEIGFGEVYDLGGNDKFELMEKLAAVWISLAVGKYGRNIGFKILKK